MSVPGSIGGKTGVDTPAGKNLVGAFHQPRLVIADLATLATLPPNHLSAGMAEAIKHGIVADAEYARQVGRTATDCLARSADALAPLVERSIRIKAAIVAEDEREHGRRAVLNFGHTIGHAVEVDSGYTLLHGEAVACGMALEAQLGRALGITGPNAVDAIIETLTAYQLPTSPPGQTDAGRLLEIMRHDKKVRDASVRFALLESVGKMRRDPTGAWTTSVEEKVVRSVLETPER